MTAKFKFRTPVVGLGSVLLVCLASCAGSTSSSAPSAAEGSVLAGVEATASSATAPTQSAEQSQQDSEADQAPQADPAPAADPTPTPDPAPAEAPAKALDPAPDPGPAASQAPVLDTVRITRRGVNVTVGINASDPDSDTLSLALIGVLGVDGETFDHAAAADGAIFELPFSPDARGTVTITTSVSDGTNVTTQTDQIDIAPLQHVIVNPGEIVASNGCFIDNDELTYRAGTTSLLLDTRAVSSPAFTDEVVEPITLNRQNRGSQLLRTTLSADFEEATGFVTDFVLSGTFGDIKVQYGSNHVQPGSYQTPTFVSPSDSRCWLNIGYGITVQPAV
jgi:hypothetical protein